MTPAPHDCESHTQRGGSFEMPPAFPTSSSLEQVATTVVHAAAGPNPLSEASQRLLAVIHGLCDTDKIAALMAADPAIVAAGPTQPRRPTADELSEKLLTYVQNTANHPGTPAAVDPAIVRIGPAQATPNPDDAVVSEFDLKEHRRCFVSILLQARDRRLQQADQNPEVQASMDATVTEGDGPLAGTATEDEAEHQKAA